MSARDKCEPEIIEALQKEGWTVRKSDFLIRLDTNQNSRGVFADLQLQRKNDEGSLEKIIVVEIKCFTPPLNELDEFYHAVGQYHVYQSGLDLHSISFPLYLILPDHLQSTLLGQTAIQMMLKRTETKFVLVNLEKREVIQWSI